MCMMLFWGFPEGDGFMSNGREKRDMSPAGVWNRANFEASLTLLRKMGLSERVLDYCRNRARVTARLPHEELWDMVEGALPQRIAPPGEILGKAP
jgi:hypothetical protein